MPRKTATTFKTAVQSCPSTAETLFNPRILSVVGVSGCQEGGVLELLVSVGVAVAVTTSVAVGVVVRIAVGVGVAVGVAVAVASDAIAVSGIIQR